MNADTELLSGPSWWASLKHGGMLVAPSHLVTYFPKEAPPLSATAGERLRRAVVRFQDDASTLPLLLDAVLEDLLGLHPVFWTKGSNVQPRWTRRSVTREALRPRMVWEHPEGGVLPVFVAEKENRIGVGKGRTAVSRVVEWLRLTHQPLALLTNGRQWRLIHAGTDYDAFCEGDVSLWFSEGGPGPQVDALRILVSEKTLRPEGKEKPGPLLAAVQASRKGQAELSGVLGERVRVAVEHLIHASATSLDPLPEGVNPRDLYIAASRLVMRCVVVLFAEARNLLPRNHPLYDASYSLGGLREQLDRAAGGRGERLRGGHSAWPRLLSLFRLVCEGSAHEALPVLRYGGALFEPGDPNARNPVLRALAALESPKNQPSDAVVHRILELLTRSRVKVRQGKGSTWVEAPVDFSDLSSEYIGILYENLLDYELRKADDIIVFLNVGHEPALPFTTLEDTNDKEKAELLEKLRKDAKTKPEGEESDDDGGEDEADETETKDEPEADPEEETPAEAEEEDVFDESDKRRVAEEAVRIWSEKAVQAAKIVRYPKNDRDPRVRETYNEQVREAGKRLIKRIVLPGDWYLVRWGGTRKGSGTFYTRPQLAGPTVRRTLQPLAYEAVHTEKDAETGVETVTEWAPRKPEEILAIKVCDPSMGSGSFLVSALRFLVDALVASLYHHDRLVSGPDRTIPRLADGLPLDHPSQETLPVPMDHPEFDLRLKAALKRHVVERCLYGVDLDPLAVELGRLALWVETMDPRLAMTFLDHKLKCGNALVGAWFDQVEDYPLCAWLREGGDRTHDRFVHHFREFEGTRGKDKGKTKKEGDKWTAAIKGCLEEEIKPELLRIVSRQERFRFAPGTAREDVKTLYQSLHALPVHATEERAILYRERFESNPAFQRLKLYFDTWCALWFWPGDKLALAPRPERFLTPGEETLAEVRRLRDEHRFFHWELEFPDVFTGPGSGFDALVGNPPWEIQKPNSKEFFSNIDPLFRTYGKEVAKVRQRGYFEKDAAHEEGWIAYCARLKGLSNWVKCAAFPFGDPEVDPDKKGVSLTRSPGLNAETHEDWRKLRAGRSGYADREHPFRHQGSADLNTYKMFLEVAHSLAKTGGRFGFVVPSGIYTDKGSTALRTLFLRRCRWEWLFGFENREKLFDIDSRFKFCASIVEKGGQTEAIRAAFMHRDLREWEEAERHVLAYPRERVEEFSPWSRVILEIRRNRDIEVLRKAYSHGVLLGDEGEESWRLEYAREYDTSVDSRFFPPLPAWERQGYRSDQYGHWLLGDWQELTGHEGASGNQVLSSDGRWTLTVDDIQKVALPLYEGRMIGLYDPTLKGWVSGKGRSAKWREIGWDAKCIEPQYLIAAGEVFSPGSKMHMGPKVAYMRIGSATNSRSVTSTFLQDVPAADSVFFFVPKDGSLWTALAVVGVFGTFAYDMMVRSRLGGLNLSEFVMIETTLPKRASIRWLAAITSRLALPLIRFSPQWLLLDPVVPLFTRWALTPHERLRLRCILDAAVAELYGLDVDDYAWILRDCDHPVARSTSNEFTRTLDPKGFWRVDKDKPPEHRHTVLAQVAFHELKKVGLDAFLALNDGDGWMLPDTLRLADYGLGHDDRAKEPQPVALHPDFQPRFYDWQLAQTPEESWEECRRHAALIEKILMKGREAAQAGKPREGVPSPVETAPQPDAPALAASPSTTWSAPPAQMDLFGRKPEPVQVGLFGETLPPPSRRGRR